MTVNRNFVDRFMSMTCVELENYANQHSMTLESLLDMICDCIINMSDQEVSELTEKYNIDTSKTEDMIKSVIEKYRSSGLN